MQNDEQIPALVAHPRPFNEILEDPKLWGPESTEQGRLELLKEQTTHGALWMAQNGYSKQEIIDSSTEFFNYYRLNAIDNGIMPGEHASARFLKSVSDTVFGSAQGLGSVGETVARVEGKADASDEALSNIATYGRQWRSEYAALKTDDQREAFRSKLESVYMTGAEDKGGVLEFAPKPQTQEQPSWVWTALQEVGGALKEGSRSKVEKMLHENPALAQSFLWSDLPDGFGNVLGFLGVSAAATAIGGPQGGAAAVAAAGVGLQAQAGKDAAKAKGATQEQEDAQVIFQGLIGSTEVVGLGGVNLLKHLPFGKKIAKSAWRYLGGGLQETGEELFQDTLINISEKYGGIDPERQIIDRDSLIRTAGVTMITGSTLAPLDPNYRKVMVETQKTANAIVTSEATSVLDGTHPAIQQAQQVVASDQATDAQKAKAQEIIATAQTRAQEMLGAVAQSESILNTVGEPEQTGRELTPFEKVGMGTVDQVNLRDASDEEFANHWKNELTPEDRRKIRGVLGVADNAPISKIREAFREKTKDVAVEPDVAAMALPELIGYHDELSKERGQAPSRVALYKTSKELEAALPVATDAAKEAGASAVGKDVSPDDLQVLGANWTEREGQVERGAIAIVEGKAAPLILAREKAQEWFRRSQDEGTFTLDDLRTARAEVEKATGEKDTHADTDEGMIEWASDYAVDYLAGKAPEAKSLPQKVREFFSRLGEYAADMVRRAIRLERAIKAGGVNARFESALAQASGLQKGEAYNPHAGLSTQESAHLAKMLADPAQADAYLGANEVPDSVVTAFDEAQRRSAAEKASVGKIKVPMFTMGKIHEETGLPLNPDGTVTLYHHTSAEKADQIKKSLKLKSAAEPDVYLTTRKETDTGYGDTAVAVQVNPDQLQIDDEFPDGRRDFRIDTGKPGGSISIKLATSTPLFTLGRKAKQPRMSRETLREHRDELTNLEREIRAQRLAAKPATEMERRLSLIGHIRTLERIVSAMPKELRGMMGGWSKLVKTGTPAKRVEQLEKSAAKAFDLLDKHTKEVVLVQLDKLVSRNLGTLDARRRLEGKIGPDATAELERIKADLELTPERAAAAMADLDQKIDKSQDADEIETLTEDLLRLVRFGGARGQTVDQLFETVDAVQDLIETGKLAEKVLAEDEKKRNAETRETMVHTATGGKGLLDPAASKRKIAETGSFLDKLQDFHRNMISWEWLLNAASRADKTTGTLKSALVKWAGRMVHRATHDEKNAIKKETRRLAEMLANVYGIDTKKAGWQFRVSKAHSKFAEETDATGAYALDIPDGARKKANIPLRQAEALRAGKIKTDALGLTAGQEAAVFDALDAHQIEVAQAKRRLDEATTELVQVPAANIEEIADAKREMKAAEAALNKLERKTKLKDVDLTDWSKVKSYQMRLSQDQALNLSMMWRQEGVSDAMKYHGISQETMDQIEAFLSPEALKIRDYLAERYEEGYDEINSVYRDIYRANLPRVRNYSPLRWQTDKVKEDNMLDSSVPAGGSTSPGFLSGRIQHRAKPDQTVGALSLYSQHMAQAHHFIHWAKPMKQMRAVLSHRNMQQAISENYGATLNKVIQERLQYFADGGNRAARRRPLIDGIRRAHAISSLSYNWGVFLKQLTAFPGYTYDMPVQKFFKYETEFFTVDLATGKKDPLAALKNAKTMWEKSEYIRTRFEEGYERDVIAVLSGALERKSGGEIKPKSALMAGIEFGMITGRAGDIIPVIVGGYAAYRHAKQTSIKDGMSEAEAEAEGLMQMEMSTDRNQQAGNIKDLTTFEMEGSLARVFTMYLTSPRQYFQSTWEAFGDARAGRAGARADFAKRLVIGHVVLPMLFQLASDVIRAPFNDDDEKDFEWKNYAAAMLLGPLNGYFLFGNAFKSIASAAFGAKDWGSSIPVIDAVEGIKKPFKHARDFVTDFDFKDLLLVAHDAARAAAKLAGNSLLVYDIGARIAQSFGLGDDVEAMLED